MTVFFNVTVTSKIFVPALTPSLSASKMTSSDLHSAVIEKYSLLYVPSRIVGVSNLTSSSSPTAPGVKLVTVKEAVKAN